MSLPCGVDVILGLNGYIWLTETLAAAGAGAGAGGADSLSKLSVGLDGAMLDMESTNEAAAEGLAEAIEKMKAVAAERVGANARKAWLRSLGLCDPNGMIGAAGGRVCVIVTECASTTLRSFVQIGILLAAA